MPNCRFIIPLPKMNMGIRRKAKINETRMSSPPPSGTINGLTSALTGRTNRQLKMFEPITLPTQRSASPFIAANTEVINSGKLVPTAITNIPTITGGTPKDSARSEP